MSNTITNAFVQQWDTGVRLLAQQKESRLAAAVNDRGSITGESFTANRLAALEDTPEKLVRHGDTVWSNADHSTRVALMRDFYQALPVDRNDEPKMIINPASGPYQSNLMSAWNRRQDAIIYAAARGNSQAKDGSLVALTAGQKIAHGGAGFTKGKLIQAKALFRANEIDEHAGEELSIVYNSVMLEDLLNDTTLTSSDYQAVKMLQSGDVAGKWMGFKWIPYEGLYFASSTYYAIAWAKSAIHRGTGFVEGKASRRGDKQDTMQVSMAGSFGATRVEEKGVVEIAFQ